jgi:hypothetical protein
MIKTYWITLILIAVGSVCIWLAYVVEKDDSPARYDSPLETWMKMSELILVILMALSLPIMAQVGTPAGQWQMETWVEWLIGKLGPQLTQVIFSGIVALLGLAAYFKSKNQKWYGIVEIMVGLFSTVVVAGTVAPNRLDLAKWTTLAGSAYVIARGLGNHADDKKKLIAARAVSAHP